MALPQWVPISERLPDVGQYVLSYSPTNKMVARDQYRYYGESFDRCDFVYKDATHWMPLPSNPKD